jgi:plastocyanin
MDRWRRLGAAVAGLTFVTVLGAGSALAADQAVAISGFTFSPRTVTVGVGDTVTWTNSDAQAHTATSGSAWDTGAIGGGDSASVTFRSAGTYDYVCSFHPAMTGRVVVRAAAGGTTPPTDTAPGHAPDGDGWLAATLAFLGIVMMVGTFVAYRRFRERQAGG